MRRTRAARLAVVAGLGVAAVLATGPAAGAVPTVGRFHTLPAGEAEGYEIHGIARLDRHAGGTSGRVVVTGLEPGRTYAAHLHNAPCSAPNPGGGHYQDVVGGPVVPPNELWFSSSADPQGGIVANRGGVARGWGSADWVARADAQSVVVHLIPPGGTTGGGPKIACADLG
jgi:hypothetical protein